MAINLSALAPTMTMASALSNIILVTPQQQIGYQPQNAFNKNGEVNQEPPTIAFHYEAEQTITIESDITDHYIEDNTAVQDQIALKPEIITTNGFIGELNDIAPVALEPLRIAADKLTTVSAYSPELTTSALIAYNTAFRGYQTAKQAVNAAVAAWSSITGNTEGVQTKQAKVFSDFYGYWKRRVLFRVRTPWVEMENCAIQSLKAVQDSETNMITDFEVTFKKMNFASTRSSLVGGIVSDNFQGRASQQASSLVDLGASSPLPSISLSSGISSMGVA